MIRESFNSDWHYYRESGSQPPKVIGPITLPHDAMLFEPRDPTTKNSYNTGYFPGGIYHYLKTFFVPDEYRNKNITLEFEGIYMNAEVYINGQLAGARPYGYSNFYIYTDRFVKYGQDNQIEVVARNDKEPNSRWYSGSGIYRNVKILVGEKIHIFEDGVKITIKDVRNDTAVVEVLTSIVNNYSEKKEIRAENVIHKQNGEVAASKDFVISLPGNGTVTTRQSFSMIEPLLWSVDAPNLYACHTKILAGEKIIDEDYETFGVRTLDLDPKNGLRINGVEVKLRGACVHHDNGIIGACALEAAEDRRVRILKASGFNAIRSAHNPISKAMLEACDRHGMLVMDEFTDVWFRRKTSFDYSSFFRDWWERDIQAIVEKDFNHPCVILYSIGNEITETATQEGAEYSRELAAKVRSLDNTRYIINSINGWLSCFTEIQRKWLNKKKVSSIHETLTDNQDKNIGELINPVMIFVNRFMDTIVSLPWIDQCTKEAYAAVDVAGYNYMAGRYRKDGNKYPRRIICGSETFPPEIAKNWRMVKKLPYVIGDFSWTGWDYLGEAGLCIMQYGGKNALFKPYPCILANSSIIDITGHRQAQSYMHEIVWGLRKEPYIAVQPVNHSGEKASQTLWRTTNAIDSWTWPGFEGRRATVEIYADAHHVELFLNGKSLGKKLAGEPHKFKAVYHSIYQPGELTAISYTADGKEISRHTLRTAGNVLKLHLQPEADKLKADGSDLAYIDILIGDERGIINPLADRLVTIEVEGAGSLAGFGSAEPFTEESYTDTTHTTYLGRALAIVRAAAFIGEIKVTASADGFEPQSLVLPVVQAYQD